MRPKKSLGQHWLQSTKALSQIIDAADPTADDIILEIGPGKGVLTERLVFFAGKVIAIEKDRELIEPLQLRFAEAIAAKRLDIVEADILDFDPEILRFYKDSPYKVVANIPYYITGAIIEKFLSTLYQPQSMVLLMQKEVAERIVAKKTKPFDSAQGKESVLSIAVKAYGNPKIVGKVPPGAFVPPPTVDSAILLIENISRDFFQGTDEKVFLQLVKTIFGKKRKQIGGSLTDFIGNKVQALNILQQAVIDTRTRPEELTLKQWKTLTQCCMETKSTV
jgi:16S rRNA (adenine1518-N6/adenine1519-N6)-dimethyltransferase